MDSNLHIYRLAHVPQFNDCQICKIGFESTPWSNDKTKLVGMAVYVVPFLNTRHTSQAARSLLHNILMSHD